MAGSLPGRPSVLFFIMVAPLAFPDIVMAVSDILPRR